MFAKLVKLIRMKKSACTFLSIVLVICALVICCSTFVGNGNFAYADTNENVYQFTEEDNVDNPTARLVTITDGNNPVGVRLSGYYFGASDIPVVVDVYSSPEFVIDFKINAVSLTETQRSTRDKLVDMLGKISQMIDYVDALANTTYDGSGEGKNKLPVSDVYRYNQAEYGQTIEISYETYDMMSIARDMYTATNGAFNPAVYRLVDLWGFSSRIYSNGNFGLPYDRAVSAEQFWTTGYPLPETKYIDAFSASTFTDFSQNAVILSEKDGLYFVTKNVVPAVVDGVEYQQWVDLGGIAKGYVVDLAKTMLTEAGIDRYNVDAGSSSMAFGLNYDGENSILGLSDAFDPLSAVFPQSLFEMYVGKSSISTSGQNVRKYTVDGVEYAHIIDGVTGAPAQTGVRSVMIVAPEGDFWATKGDCLTTALTVMGRDKIVEFVNGYLKDNNIQIVVLYQTLDGKKQILSNIDEDAIFNTSDSFDEFNWSLKLNDNGDFYYDVNAKFTGKANGYKWILITLGCICGAVMLGLIVYHFVKGRKSTVKNVQYARKDKPFKVADVAVYLLVALLIVVLLFNFVFDVDSKQVQIVNVIDDEIGETLFVYNVVRGEYLVNTDNANGWTILVVDTDDGVQVTLSREVDGETRYNTVTITRGQTPSVKMTDSLCGFHQDCVRNFPEITRSGGAIVCSPNRLKIVTE